MKKEKVLYVPTTWLDLVHTLNRLRIMYPHETDDHTWVKHPIEDRVILLRDKERPISKLIVPCAIRIINEVINSSEGRSDAR